MTLPRKPWNRRAFLKACALGSLLPLTRHGAAAGGIGSLPNIVFIFVDDMGFADPSCFGNPVMKTPNLDALASEGIRFAQFYVNSPICSPSRVAVTTGQYPARWGIHSFLETREYNRARGMADWLDPAAPTIARFLKQRGYATAHFGKWHLGGGRDVGDAPRPQAYGLDESLVSFEGLGDRILPPGGLSDASEKLGRGEVRRVAKHEQTGIYVDRAIEFIRRHRDGPFYVRVFPNDVHDGHHPAPGSEEAWKGITENPFEQRFFAVLEELDRQIGRLVGEIDRLGLAERTLIVFASDNGPTDWPFYYERGWNPPGFTGPFFGRKWTLYEGGIRVPFIARWRGVIPAGAVDDQTILCGIDLAPTFCHLAGVAAPPTPLFDGEDMSAALKGEPRKRQRPVFWQYGAPHARCQPGNPDFAGPSLAVRDGKWKLLANPDGSEAQLYNLSSDPGERSNLLEAHPARAAGLWTRLRSWAREMGFGTEDADLIPPLEPVELLLAGKRRRFRNHGVKVVVERTGESGTGGGTKGDRPAGPDSRGEGGKERKFLFRGPDSRLELPRRDAPEVAGRPLTVAATVEPVSAAGETTGAEKPARGRQAEPPGPEDGPAATVPEGVILAHGGSKTGYSLYLQAGKPVFSVCIKGRRTTIHAASAVPSGPHHLAARLERGGRMILLADGIAAAEGEAPGLLEAEPGDSLQVGADLVQAVGEYEPPFGFTGVLSRIGLRIGEP